MMVSVVFIHCRAAAGVGGGWGGRERHQPPVAAGSATQETSSRPRRARVWTAANFVDPPPPQCDQPLCVWAAHQGTGQPASVRVQPVRVGPQVRANQPVCVQCGPSLAGERGRVGPPRQGTCGPGQPVCVPSQCACGPTGTGQPAARHPWRGPRRSSSQLEDTAKILSADPCHLFRLTL